MRTHVTKNLRKTTSHYSRHVAKMRAKGYVVTAEVPQTTMFGKPTGWARVTFSRG